MHVQRNVQNLGNSIATLGHYDLRTWKLGLKKKTERTHRYLNQRAEKLTHLRLCLYLGQPGMLPRPPPNAYSRPVHIQNSKRLEF